MILPSKTVAPVDSLICISAYVIEILKDKAMNIDELLELFNERYDKPISMDKMMLAINFLYLIDVVEYHDEIIKINVK
ncbi:ABC-three component system middle component 6 [Basilea psittacipulmonis]|uniref:Uncharacterized protein n=1 Tax=Basilea psittacipulmonis DSM 24701 TaxID=1072685 RepID=A0A077DFM4_9BURK|nr:ABC-three component system middle component 6 [Basilea psittacipulmonis]AIL31968.1 hypothetical protein IX83_00295 [Basilea psittacipulmonis DSM 24701]